MRYCYGSPFPGGRLLAPGLRITGGGGAHADAGCTRDMWGQKPGAGTSISRQRPGSGWRGNVEDPKVLPCSPQPWPALDAVKAGFPFLHSLFPGVGGALATCLVCASVSTVLAWVHQHSPGELPFCAAGGLRHVPRPAFAWGLRGRRPWIWKHTVRWEEGPTPAAGTLRSPPQLCKRAVACLPEAPEQGSATARSHLQGSQEWGLNPVLRGSQLPSQALAEPPE